MVSEMNSMTLLFASSYLVHDHGLSPPQVLIGRLVVNARLRGVPVIIGADVNSIRCGAVPVPTNAVSVSLILLLVIA